jgi:hypothetical protein
MPFMVAFTALPCPVGVRAFVVALPLLAGLGSYAFLRAERASRAASTVAGAGLAGLMAGTLLTSTVAFSGFMAMAPWMLMAISRVFSASHWGTRLGWSVAAALAWGQVAAAHISNGLVMGSGLLTMFVIYKAYSGWRERRLRLRTVIAMLLALSSFFVLANLAYLLPRVLLLERSSIGLGYEELKKLGDELQDKESRPSRIKNATEPAWILRLGTSPGAHIAAAALALSFAALLSRRHRGTYLVLLLFSLLFYLLGLRIVAKALQPLIGDTFLGTFYSHAPSRFVYAPLLALPLMAGIGLQAWLDEKTWRRRIVLALPGIALWWAAPLMAGALPERMIILLIGGIASIVVLAAVHVRPVLSFLVPLIVAIEVATNGLVGQTGRFHPVANGLPPPNVVALNNLKEPEMDPALLMRPPANVRSADPPLDERWLGAKASDDRTVPKGVPHKIIFKIEEVQGYNPVQLMRYWSYWRSLPTRVSQTIRATVATEVPPPSTLNLFQVGWVERVIGGELPEHLRNEVLVAKNDFWLIRIRDVPSKATAFSAWEIVGSAEDARRAVTRSTFDPAETLVLEDDPGVPEAASAGRDHVVFDWVDPSRARIEVDLAVPSVILVRIPYDVMWTATIDGEEAAVFPADYVMQGLSVDAGAHTIELAYRDPWVMRGLLGSGIFLGLVGIAAVVIRSRSATRRSRIGRVRSVAGRVGPPPPDGDDGEAEGKVEPR